MRLAARFLTLPLLAGLVSCHPPPRTTPTPSSADAKVVLGFLEAYGQRDLEGMSNCLADDAVFLGSAGSLSKPQIREFFRTAFRKHPKLRVEVISLRDAQGEVQAVVKVETEAIWTDTWIFELKNHRIHRYTLVSVRR